MPLWFCDFEGCKRPGVRWQGDCQLCDRHLCSLHVTDDFHKCPKWEVCFHVPLKLIFLKGKQDAEAYDPLWKKAVKTRIERLLRNINLEALAARASELRNGMPCKVPSPEYVLSRSSDVMGRMNYHLEIRFDDGAIWLARVRQFDATSSPPALRDLGLRSEYATYKFLENTAVPAPKVFDLALEGPENPVGVGYILMEKLPGKSLKWPPKDAHQRTHILEQYANILVELRKYPFDRIGCLNNPHSGHVGPLIRDVFADSDGVKVQTLGPFTLAREFRTAPINLVLRLIMNEERYTDRPVDWYLAHLFFLDLVPLVTSSRIEDSNQFFLKHVDDKGDHLLVDENYNITGIIDWEWAHTVPEALAFAPPMMVFHVGDFFDGKNTVSDAQLELVRILQARGQQAMAEHVLKGMVHHRFDFCCGLDQEGWSTFEPLFQGLRDLLDVDAGMDWDQWKRIALERYKDNGELQMILQREETRTRKKLH